MEGAANPLRASSTRKRHTRKSLLGSCINRTYSGWVHDRGGHRKATHYTGRTFASIEKNELSFSPGENCVLCEESHGWGFGKPGQEQGAQEGPSPPKYDWQDERDLGKEGVNYILVSGVLESCVVGHLHDQSHCRGLLGATRAHSPHPRGPFPCLWLTQNGCPIL